MLFFKKLKKFFGFSKLSYLSKLVDRKLKKININELFKYSEDRSSMIEKIKIEITHEIKKETYLIYSEKKIEKAINERVVYWAKRFNKSVNAKEIELAVLCAYISNFILYVSDRILLVMLKIYRISNFLNYYNSKLPFILMVLDFLKDKNLISEKHRISLYKKYNALKKNIVDVKDGISVRKLDPNIDEEKNKNMLAMLKKEEINHTKKMASNLDKIVDENKDKQILKKEEIEHDKKMPPHLDKMVNEDKDKQILKKEEIEADKNIHSINLDLKQSKMEDKKIEINKKYEINIQNGKENIVNISGNLSDFKNFYEIDEEYKNINLGKYSVVFAENSQLRESLFENIKKEAMKIKFEGDVKIIFEDNTTMINNIDGIKIHSKKFNISLLKGNKVKISGELDSKFSYSNEIKKFELLTEFDPKAHYVSIADLYCEEICIENMKNETSKIIFEDNVKIILKDSSKMTKQKDNLEIKNKEFVITVFENDVLKIFGKISDKNFNYFDEVKKFELLNEEFCFKEYKLIFVKGSQIDETCAEFFSCGNKFKEIIFEDNIKFICEDELTITNFNSELKFDCKDNYNIVFSDKENTIKMLGNFDYYYFDFENKVIGRKVFKLLYGKIDFKNLNIFIMKGSKIREKNIAYMKKIIQEENIIFEDNVQIICEDFSLTTDDNINNIKLNPNKKDFLINFLKKENKIKIYFATFLYSFNFDKIKENEILKLLCKNFNFNGCDFVVVKDSKIDKKTIIEMNKEMIFERNVQILYDSNTIITNYNDNVVKFEAIGGFKVNFLKKENRIEIYFQSNIFRFDFYEIKENKILKLLFNKSNFENCSIVISANSKIEEKVIGKIKKDISSEKEIIFENNVQIICIDGKTIVTNCNNESIEISYLENKIVLSKQTNLIKIYCNLNFTPTNFNEKLKNNRALNLLFKKFDIREYSFLFVNNSIVKENFINNITKINENIVFEKNVSISLENGMTAKHISIDKIKFENDVVTLEFLKRKQVVNIFYKSDKYFDFNVEIMKNRVFKLL
ncbi:MAG: hypothetical protein FWC41_09275, partial [Firmicutes bacterium]|nr:hypothetical protein [Bacillota bacterium]